MSRDIAARRAALQKARLLRRYACHPHSEELVVGFLYLPRVTSSSIARGGSHLLRHDESSPVPPTVQRCRVCLDPRKLRASRYGPPFSGSVVLPQKSPQGS